MSKYCLSNLVPWGLLLLSGLDGPENFTLMNEALESAPLISALGRRSMSDEQDGQERFSVRVAARLSGIAAERVRSRETRHHAAVSPARSGGEGRQYSAAELKRLRLLGRAVASGHRIGDIATLDDAVLTDLSKEETERVWEAGLMPISSERMATGILRSLLLDRLDSIRSSDGVGPRIIFATPSGERRDPGLLVARPVVVGKRSEVVFRGAEVPVPDFTLAVEGSRINVLDLGIVTEDSIDVAGCFKNVKRRLDKRAVFGDGSRGMTRGESISCGDHIEYVDRFQEMVLELRGNDYASTQQPWVKEGTS